MVNDYKFRKVRDHVEVYDASNQFVLSADTLAEARMEVKKLEEEGGDDDA